MNRCVDSSESRKRCLREDADITGASTGDEVRTVSAERGASILAAAVPATELLMATLMALAVANLSVPWSYKFENTKQVCVAASADTARPNNTRFVFSAVPDGPPPPSGWPVLISLEVEGFASAHGFPSAKGLCGNSTWSPGGSRHDGGGHAREYTAYPAWATPKDALASCFYPNGSYCGCGLVDPSRGHGGCHPKNRPGYAVDTWDSEAGGMWMQRAKQLLVANGVAVLSVNPYGVDSMDWTEASWESALDKPFYHELLKRGRAGAFGALDFDRVVLRGYSAGAQMVSWLTEVVARGEFDGAGAGMKLRGGVLISGGRCCSCCCCCCCCCCSCYCATAARADALLLLLL